MRNAFKDMYDSIALREAQRMRSELHSFQSVRQQAFQDILVNETTRWKDIAGQDALKMSELAANILGRDSYQTASEHAIKSITGMQTSAKISELILGTIQTKPFLEAAEAANASISKIFADTQAGIKLSNLHDLISKEWMIPREALARGFVEAAGLTKFQSHFASIAGVSSLAETCAGNINKNYVGELLGLSAKLSSSLAQGFAGFSRSYQNLFESFENNQSRILEFRPSLVRMPTVEYYNGALLTRSVTSAAEDWDYVEDEDTESLEYFLSRLNPDLVGMLRGAREALTSTNPDRVRHFSTSLRELLTHVLHTLAPDHKIESWSTSQEHFVKGRPTRKARLHYICREIDHEPFDQFVAKDIDAVLEFFQLFHEGTHRVVSKFTSRQLRAMQTRVESAIRFLLEISDGDQR